MGRSERWVSHGSQLAEITERLAPGIEVEDGFPWSMAWEEKLSLNMLKAKRLLGFDPNIRLTMPYEVSKRGWIPVVWKMIVGNLTDEGGMA